MLTFRYSFRVFYGSFVLLCALVALTAFGVGRPSISVVLMGVTYRLLGIVIVGFLFGVFMGRVLPAVACAAIGVIFADITWNALLFVFDITKEPRHGLYNPLIIVALLTCPPAAAVSRERAIVVGFSIAFLLPLVVAFWLISGKTRLGSLGLIFTISSMLLAIAAGTAGTVVTRIIWEIAGRTVEKNKK